MVSMSSGDDVTEAVVAMLLEVRPAILVRRVARALIINACLGFVFFIVASTGDLAHQWGAPRLHSHEPWEYESIANLVKAVSGDRYEFVRLGLVKAGDAPDPEGSPFNGGVEDVNGGFSDRPFGGIANTKQDG